MRQGEKAMKTKPLLLAARWILRLALAAWIGFSLWSSGRSLSDLSALRAEGRPATAQVIGREILDQNAKIGYVHYAFRVGALAVEDRFQVPRTEYAQYWTGRPYPVTYLPSNPHVFRLGTVGDTQVRSRGVLAVILLLGGSLAIGLPLMAVEATLHPRPTATL